MRNYFDCSPDDSSNAYDDGDYDGYYDDDGDGDDDIGEVKWIADHGFSPREASHQS